MDNLNLLLSIFIIIILVLCICSNLNINAESFISGYGFGMIVPTNTNNYVSSIIPHNLITKSTDFKLLSLVNQLKYRYYVFLRIFRNSHIYIPIHKEHI